MTGSPRRITALVVGAVSAAILTAPAVQAQESSDPYAPVTAELTTGPRGAPEVVPEAVIGGDNRKLVRRTTGNVGRRVVYLTGTMGSRRFSCSGSMIGPDAVATAAHCLYDTSANRFATNLRVFPGRDGGFKPFGSCRGIQAGVAQGWVAASGSTGDQRYDFGRLELNCDVGWTTGWFGLAVASNPGGAPVKLNGYPGDKPNATQWRSSGRITKASAHRLKYDADTYSGSSGGPVYNPKAFFCLCIVAINTLEEIGLLSAINSGTRITAPVKGFLEAPIP